MRPMVQAPRQQQLDFSTAPLKERFESQVSRDLMEQQPLERLRHNATKCRDLAGSAMTSAARDVLNSLAQHYEEKLVALEASEDVRHRRPAFKWPLT
jgi:hypothetical protein